MIWTMLDPRCRPEMLVLLNAMLSEDDPRSARDQFDSGYAQSGGWRPMQGFTMEQGKLLYPDDPAMSPWAMTVLRREVIYVYPHDWVVILQEDNTFEVCRMD